MGSLQLECPLCCNETFSSHDTLKHHLLTMIDNLVCPSCELRFEKIFDLAEHLGRDCCESNIKEDAGDSNYEQIIIKQEESDEGENEKESCDETMPNDSKSDKDVSENVEVPTKDEENEQELYYCSSCATSFSSVQEHIQEYHQGQEVFLEVP